MNKNILFIFNFGSELRQFVHSGLIEKLLLEKKKVFISSKHCEKEFIDCIPSEVNILPFYGEQNSYSFNIINSALNATSKSQLNFDPFKLSFRSVFSYLLNFIILFLINLFKYQKIRDLFIKIENIIAKRNYSNNWVSLLSENNIDVLITTVPNINISLQSSALKLKVKRVLIFHTNKDLYSIDRFIIPYNKYGVWNYSMKERLHSEFNIPINLIEIIGCLHFFYLMEDYINTYTDLQIITKNLVKNKSNQFVYICGALNYNDEDVLVASFIDKCDKIFGNNYKIILRINPMETRDIWDKFKSPRVDLMYPEWHYNKKSNFNYATSNDLRLFSSILLESKAIFGLPSTFFIESSLLSTPFILLLLNPNIRNTTSSSNIFNFWKQKIFDNARCSKTILPIESSFDLEDIIYQLKNNYQLLKLEQYDSFLENEIYYKKYSDTMSAHLNLLSEL